MYSVAKTLFNTALKPNAPASYRPGGGEPVRPIVHPIDGQPGYILRLPSGKELFADGTGALRSLPN